MIYPRLSKSRTVISLNGIWNFYQKGENEYYVPNHPLGKYVAMPVPSSYQDIYEGREYRNHMGDVIYERYFDFPDILKNERVVLRFGSVTHKAKVFLNGKLIGGHFGGFLPFEIEIDSNILLSRNRLTVVVNNIVDYTTLPCGRVIEKNYPGLKTMKMNLPNFDFFNYSGIMRPVVLYTTPKHYVENIVVSGDMYGAFRYKIQTFSESDKVEVEIKYNGCVLWNGKQKIGEGHIDNVKLWSSDNPELYTIVVKCYGIENDTCDVVEENFGFRSFYIDKGKLVLNGKEIYLKGFGKHEDSIVLGRGYSNAINVKDIALMKWIGANSFRTSHYPYSEEMMQLCDKEGILVIDEVPAVGLHTGFSATGLLGGKAEDTWNTVKTFNHHKQVIKDLILRDQNHPCIIMWSIANEPASEEAGAKEYFEPLIQLAKDQDCQKRPVTIVTYGGATPEKCNVAGLVDVLMINRYNGWYDTEGDLKGAVAILGNELERFHAKYPQKPIVFGEFGVDTIAGIHDINSGLFSEEYQRDFIQAYCELFKTKEYVCGEHVWNFADFATAENIKRVQGNKKGIFTRDRQPKMAAYYLKEHWNTQRR